MKLFADGRSRYWWLCLNTARAGNAGVARGLQLESSLAQRRANALQHWPGVQLTFCVWWVQLPQQIDQSIGDPLGSDLFCRGSFPVVESIQDKSDSFSVSSF